MRKRKAWREYPERCCYTMHECLICGKAILLGQMYFDGGYPRRAHKDCVIFMERQEHTEMSL